MRWQTRRGGSRAAVGAGVSWALWALGSLPSAHASDKDTVLEEGDAAVTLVQYALKRRIQVIFKAEDVLHVRTQPLVAGLEGTRPELEAMLAGTPLEEELINPWLAVVRVRHGSPSPSEVTIRAQKTREVPQRGAYTLSIDPAELPQVGVTAVPDTLRAFTQQFNSVCSDGLSSSSHEANTNSARACAPDLRGLGSSATLVLVDGRRLAGSGTDGLITDLNQIPLGAVEHIDTTFDISSALYGADAIAGFINIRLRREFDGFETRATVIPGIGGAASTADWSQLMGLHLGPVRGVVVFEYLHQDALPADRRLAGTSDLRPLGGGNFDSAFGDPANLIRPSGIYAVPVRPPDVPLTAADFTQTTPHLYDTRTSTDLLPRQDIWSLFASGHDELGSADVYGDVLITNRRLQDDTTAIGVPLLVPATNPYYLNSLGGGAALIVDYGFLNSLGPSRLQDDVWSGNVAIGAHFEPASGIRMHAFASYSAEHLRETVDGGLNQVALATALASSDPSQALDPFQDGVTSAATWHSIEGRSVNESTSDVTQIHVAAESGAPYFSKGVMKLGAGLDWRRESLDSVSRAAGLSASTQTNAAREVMAAFATACVPLIGPGFRECGDSDAQGRPVDLMLTGRYEHYSDAHGSFTPTVTLVWLVNPTLQLSASFAQSAREGGLSDVSAAHSTSETALLPDPKSPSGYSQTLIWSGGHPGLKPETGTTGTFTLTWTPEFTPQLLARLHLFYIDFSHRIDNPIYSSEALTDPSLEGLVVRAPTPEQQRAVCSQSQYNGGYGACMNSYAAALLDIRVQNLTQLTTDGLDLDIEKGWDSPFGHWSARLHHTYVDRYVVRQGATEEELVNTAQHPLHVRANGALAWTEGDLTTTVSTDYWGGYRDSTSQPNRSIRSWTTIDVLFQWQFKDDNASVLANSSLSLGVRNAMGKTAPFYNNPAGLGVDPANSDLSGREWQLSITKRFK